MLGNSKSQIQILASLLCLSFLFSQTVFALSESSNYKLYGGQFQSTADEGSSSNYNIDSGAMSVGSESASGEYNLDQGAAVSSVTTEVTAPAGNPAISAGAGAGGDQSGPQIIDLEIINIGTNAAQIIFNTDEQALSRINYGLVEADTFSPWGYSYLVDNHSHTLFNLVPNAEYSFYVEVKDKIGNGRNIGPYKFSTLPIITQAPNVSNFTAESREWGILLGWTNPSIDNLKEIIVVRNSAHYPASINDGDQVFRGLAELYRDTQLESRKYYYYAIFVVDSSDNISSGAIASVTAPEITPEVEITPEEVEELPIEDEEEVVGEVEPPPSDEEVFEELIPAEPVKLPPQAQEVPEETRLSKDIVKIFSLIRQGVTRGYGQLSETIKNMSEEAKEKLGSIKEGLVDQFGNLRSDVYETLTDEERLQVESFISKPYPMPGDQFGRLNDFFRDLLPQQKELIQTIKPDLLNRQGYLDQDIYIQLTPEEKQRIEEAVETKLPSISDRINYVADIFRKLSDDALLQVNKVKHGLVDQFGNIQPHVYEFLTPQEKTQIEDIVGEPLPPVFDSSTVVNVVPFSIPTDQYGADWHVFADTQALLSLPKSSFTKEVNVIIATMATEAYVLKHNADNDSYEAVISVPKEKGKYQLILQVIYTDNTYEEIHNTVLVDPYGYVYEKKFFTWNKEKPWQFFTGVNTYVKKVQVEIFTKNKTGEWVSWPAHLYNQFNPQTTGDDGNFAFVVPPGEYYLIAKADGYKDYKGKPFEVKDMIINTNIKLKKSRSYLYYILAGFVLILFLGAYLNRKKKNR